MADIKSPAGRAFISTIGAAAGGVFGTIVGAIGTILGGILGGGSGSLSSLQNALSGIGEQVNAGFQALGDLIGWLAGGGLLGWLAKLWDFLKGILSKLKDWLGKLAKVIQKIRDLHDALYRRFIGPILNAIQHVRQLLVIFRLFHLKFAQKLDATLADVEGKIAANFELVWRSINQLISWAQIITTADGLFDPGTFWGTVRRDLATLRSLVGIGPVEALDSLAAAKAAADRALFSSAAVRARESTWSAGQMPSVFADLLRGIRSEGSSIEKGG